MGQVSKGRMKYMMWIGILAFLMAGIYFYTHRESGGKRAAPMKPAAQVLVMEKRDMGRKVVLSGETVPRASVDISPKYAGRISEVLVDLGDRVKTGDVLLAQDTRDLTISIAENSAGSEQATAEAVTSRSEYDAGILKAESDYENALKTYERYETLFASGAVSRQERDDTYRAMMSAKASLESLTKQDMGGRPAVVAAKAAAARKAASQVEALEVQREDMTLISPIDGVVGYRDAEVGEWATAGEKLLTIVDTGSLYLDAAVAEQDMGVLREGMELMVSIDSLGESVPGKIIYLSPSMDAATHSYKARLLLDAGDLPIRGGMFGRAEVSAVQRKDTLYVPKEAVTENNGKRYVFVIDDGLIAHRREVTIGLSNDEEVEIKSGLSIGEKVAVSHISKLKEGMEVSEQG